MRGWAQKGNTAKHGTFKSPTYQAWCRTRRQAPTAPCSSRILLGTHDEASWGSPARWQSSGRRCCVSLQGCHPRGLWLPSACSAYYAASRGCGDVQQGRWGHAMHLTSNGRVGMKLPEMLAKFLSSCLSGPVSLPQCGAVHVTARMKTHCCCIQTFAKR